MLGYLIFLMLCDLPTKPSRSIAIDVLGTPDLYYVMTSFREGAGWTFSRPFSLFCPTSPPPPLGNYYKLKKKIKKNGGGGECD